MVPPIVIAHGDECVVAGEFGPTSRSSAALTVTPRETRTMSFNKPLTLTAAVAVGITAGALGIMATARNAAPTITEAEVIAAQKAWGDALVQIGKDFEKGGLTKAKQTANTALDTAYGYNLGPVLFKPTLTTAPHTFRKTRDGALAYFIGDNSAFPNDKGFALKGWKSVEVKNQTILINGDIAKTMGRVALTGKDGKVTEVDKTRAFKKDDAGKLRIIVHHSSLPHTPTPAPQG
jgi:hypothetical protein